MLYTVWAGRLRRKSHFRDDKYPFIDAHNQILKLPVIQQIESTEFNLATQIIKNVSKSQFHILFTR